MKDNLLLSSPGLLSQKEAWDTTLSVCNALLEEINTPRSLAVHILIRYEQWDLVAEGLPIDALWYDDPESFFLDYQATKLLTKADFLPTTFDRKAIALGRFESAETACSDTNRRWRSWLSGGSIPIEPDVDRVISTTRRLIHSILGRFPHEKLLEHCRWGPGATTSISNPRTSVYEKYLEPVTGSGLCLTLFGPLVEQATLWHSFQKGVYCVSDGNKVVLVPKNAKTERSIAVEPSLDTYFQLGIGRLMRYGLRRFGVDLSSQEPNRDLARYGSLTGKVATVDLSMASDTASKVVIENMFPADWLLAMKCCRSSHWRMGKASGVYAKFSSMGNGYTFEMETVLFLATALAVADELGLPKWEVCAFGDDLTIGVEGYDLLTRALAFLGFKTNGDKSFGTGPFRESCGKDYFLGTNVRPYFVRSLLRDVRDLKKFHNGVLKGLRPFRKTAGKALRLADPQFRLFGPASLGDTVFYSSAPRGWWKPASQKYPMFEGYIVRHWVFKPERDKVKFLEPALLASLYSKEESPTLGMSTLRKRGTWVTRTVIVPSWE